jgi:hypothetical protein
MKKTLATLALILTAGTAQAGYYAASDDYMCKASTMLLDELKPDRSLFQWEKTLAKYDLDQTRVDVTYENFKFSGVLIDWAYKHCPARY